MSTAPARAAITWYNGFESGFGDIGYHYKCRSNQYTVVTSPRKAGTYSIKTYQAGNQCCTEGTECKHRTLVLWANNQVRLPWKQWAWVGFAVYIPSDFPASSHGGIAIHGMTGQGGNHEWALFIQSDKFNLHRRRADGPEETIWTKAITRGAWHTFVAKVYRSNGSDGRYSLWHNGSLVVNNFAGSNAPDGSVGNGAYVRTGIYWGPKTRSANYTLYFDELRIGDANSSYSEVAPR